MKKRLDLELIVPIVLLSAAVLLAIFFIFTRQEKFDNHVILLNDGIKSSGCVTAYLEAQEDNKMYSFDDGKKWSKSNYGLICKNGTTVVLSKDENDKEKKEAKIEIDTLIDNAPVMEINFDHEIIYLNEDSILEEVNAYSDGKNISPNVTYQVKDYNDSTYIITYMVRDNQGLITSVNRLIKKDKIVEIPDEGEPPKEEIPKEEPKVEPKEEPPKEEPKKEETKPSTPVETPKQSDDIGTIYFDKENYLCKEEEVINGRITVSSSSNQGILVRSFGSSNNNIATIVKDPNVTNCVNCTAVIITCHKAGSVKLNAMSSTGAKTEVTLNVTKREVGTISFEKKSYTCNIGTSFNTTITANNSSEAVSVKSFMTDNPSVATIENRTDANCTNNCQAVKVNCVGSGKAYLKAYSTTGAETAASVDVSKNVGTISFDKTSISCVAGSTVTSTITANSLYEVVKVESYSSSDPTIATIEKNTSYISGCTNCETVTITCKKSGKVTLNAKSTSGATTSIEAVVKETGTVKFGDKTSYSCSAGKTISKVLVEARCDDCTIRTEAGEFVLLKSYGSNNSSIAKVTDNKTIQPNCPNCRMVDIKCVKKGTTTLYATSTFGAKTTVNITVK